MPNDSFDILASFESGKTSDNFTSGSGTKFTYSRMNCFVVRIYQTFDALNNISSNVIINIATDHFVLLFCNVTLEGLESITDTEILLWSVMRLVQ